MFFYLLCSLALTAYLPTIDDYEDNNDAREQRKQDHERFGASETQVGSSSVSIFDVEEVSASIGDGREDIADANNNAVGEAQRGSSSRIVVDAEEKNTFISDNREEIAGAKNNAASEGQARSKMGRLVDVVREDGFFSVPLNSRSTFQLWAESGADDSKRKRIGACRQHIPKKRKKLLAVGSRSSKKKTHTLDFAASCYFLYYGTGSTQFSQCKAAFNFLVVAPTCLGVFTWHVFNFVSLIESHLFMAVSFGLAKGAWRSRSMIACEICPELRSKHFWIPMMTKLYRRKPRCCGMRSAMYRISAAGEDSSFFT